MAAMSVMIRPITCWLIAGENTGNREISAGSAGRPATRVVAMSGTRCPAARQRSIASDLADDLIVLWAGAGSVVLG